MGSSRTTFLAAFAALLAAASLPAAAAAAQDDGSAARAEIARSLIGKWAGRGERRDPETGVTRPIRMTLIVEDADGDLHGRSSARWSPGVTLVSMRADAWDYSAWSPTGLASVSRPTEDGTGRQVRSWGPDGKAHEDVVARWESLSGPDESGDWSYIEVVGPDENGVERQIETSMRDGVLRTLELQGLPSGELRLVSEITYTSWAPRPTR